MRLSSLGMLSLLLAAGCASQTDHFFTLSAIPAGMRDAQVVPRGNVLLSVTLPYDVDRSEMVVDTGGNSVSILDHERWAAPLGDQFTQVLARDIERRRADLLVADQRFVQDATAPLYLKVDVVEMTVPRSGHVALRAHWRIVSGNAGVDLLGSGSFEAPIAGRDYAAIAQALSECVGLLAERLGAQLP